MAKKEAMDLLLENTIALQKTLAGLATELKTLNKKVSELFELFEAASSAFKEAKATGGAEIPADISEKIDMLVEQNKTLAKGLLLLEKTVREKPSSTSATMPLTRPSAKPLKPLKKKPAQEETESEEEYQAQPLPEFSF